MVHHIPPPPRPGETRAEYRTRREQWTHQVYVRTPLIGLLLLVIFLIALAVTLAFFPGLLA